MILERKRRRLNENDPDKKSDDYRSTVNSINESTSEVQGPKDDDNENESRKAWTMEMLMSDSDNSANHLCSVSQNKNEAFSEGKESTRQESQDKSKHDGRNKMEAELKTIKNESMTKKEIVQSAMMCWEPTSNLTEEEPLKEPERVTKKPVEKTEKQKHGEEHVGLTLDTSSRLNISIEEYCWEREADASTLETEEPDQQQVVFIMNLEDG